MQKAIIIKYKTTAKSFNVMYLFLITYCLIVLKIDHSFQTSLDRQAEDILVVFFLSTSTTTKTIVTMTNSSTPRPTTTPTITPRLSSSVDCGTVGANTI